MCQRMDILEGTDVRGRKRYVIGYWDERNCNYIASMHAEGKRLTGCHSVCAREIEGLIANANVTTYATRYAAVRARNRLEKGE